jgi:hypothetical protein
MERLQWVKFLGGLVVNKGIALGIIFLFVLMSFTSITGGNIEQTSYSSNAGELAWWKASECDGTTLWDCSGHNNHGSIYGADWDPGCCLDFDGVDDYVDLDNHSLNLGINKTDDYTIIIRFKSTGSGMLYSMSHTNPDRAYFDLMMDGDGKIGVIMGDVTCTYDLYTTGSYNDGAWHVIECEFYGDTTNPTMNLYIDGDLENTTTEWLCPMINEDFLTAKLGRVSNTESDFFDGVIDDVKIYKSDWWWWSPLPPTINGPSHGKPGQLLTYTFNAEDPDGDDVRFHIDWGDGFTEWTTYVPEGTDKSVSHIWAIMDTYQIEAWTEDEDGLWSYYPTILTITIPRDKAINNVFSWRLFVQMPLIQKLFIFC